MNGINDRIYSIEQAADVFVKGNNTNNIRATENGFTFRDIFQQKVINHNELKFSKHANQRLESRNINLSESQMFRLNQGVSKARDKSINESLVVMDNLAFIVNIKNNTVVTALESDEDNNVFTNIDGAVIV